MTTIDFETRLDFPFFTEELAEQVSAIIQADLDDAPFLDKITFGPIVVEPQYYIDEESLNVYIVYTGERESLDVRWTVGMHWRIRDKLEEAGITQSISRSFVPMSEWEVWDEYDEEDRAELDRRYGP